MEQDSIPSYAVAVSRSGNHEDDMRITELRLAANAPTRQNARVHVSVSMRGDSVVIDPDGMSKMVFRPGALQSALADLGAKR